LPITGYVMYQKEIQHSDTAVRTPNKSDTPVDEGITAGSVTSSFRYTVRDLRTSSHKRSGRCY